MDSRAVTSYLRGGAIILVMAIHYVGLYAQDYVPFSVNVFTSQIVYFFFVLSGFGIYYSLEKAYEGRNSWGRFLLSFYSKRAIRIYPIFWLALLLTPFFVPGLDTRSLTLHNAGIYLGAPWLRGDSFFWFVSALIQCYLLAPFIYLVLKKVGPSLFLGMTLLLTDFLIFLTIAIRYFDVKIPVIQSLEPFVFFGNLLLENVLLFAMGMVMPALISRYGRLLKSSAVIGLPLLALAILASFYLTITVNVFFSNSQVFYAVLAIIGIPLFCSYMIALSSERVMPLRKPVAFLGVYSFSLYLFHPQYYGILDHLGLTSLGKVSPVSLAFTLLLFPLFLGACVLLEKGLNALRERSAPLLQSLRRPFVSKEAVGKET